MTHKKHLHGGMRLGDVSGLPDKPTNEDIIKALISNVESCRVISDTSRHSFVVELTMRNFNLINTYGVKVNQFCVKLLLVNHSGVGEYKYNEHKKSVIKRFICCLVYPFLKKLINNTLHNTEYRIQST